jgi:hypothetical protein
VFVDVVVALYIENRTNKMTACSKTEKPPWMVKLKKVGASWDGDKYEVRVNMGRKRERNSKGTNIDRERAEHGWSYRRDRSRPWLYSCTASSLAVPLFFFSFSPVIYLFYWVTHTHNHAYSAVCYSLYSFYIIDEIYFRDKYTKVPQIISCF